MTSYSVTGSVNYAAEVTEGESTSLTITDEWVTVKVFSGHDTSEMTRFALRIADQIPPGTRPLRGHLDPIKGRAALQFKRGANKRFGYVYGKESD